MPASQYGNRDRDGTTPLSPEEVYETLASRHRRYALHYLHRFRPDATIQDVAAFVAERAAQTGDEAVDHERLLSELHHTHLPKLADAGLVEYDPATETVTYRGDRVLEAHLEFVAARDLLED